MADKENEKFDYIVIGAGPAGLSSAQYAARSGLKTVVLDPAGAGGQVLQITELENYPGVYPLVNGADFMDNMRTQAEAFGAKIELVQVTSIDKTGADFVVTSRNKTFTAPCLCIASGAFHKNLGVPGETEFTGRGVSYCATCDGFLYKGKDIIVTSSSKEFEHEVKYLADLAKTVKFIPLYKDYEINNDNVEIIKGMPKGITKENKKLYLDINGNKLEADGIFMLKAAISPAVLVPGLEAAEGHIVVDRQMNTNLKGVFACGDCTGRPYQYAKAVGEGNVAAHSVVSYLSKLK
jgi:thioredoxin reductase (NADPH)